MFLITVNKQRSLLVQKIVVPRISDALCIIQDELLDITEDLWEIRIEPTDIHYFKKETNAN